MKEWTIRWAAMAACVTLAAACGSEDGGDAGNTGSGNAGAANAGTGTGTAGGDSTTGAPTGGNDTGGAAGAPATSGSGASADGSSGSQPGGDATPAAGDDTGRGSTEPEVMEMLDPDVDWTALELIFPRMYSAWDGVHVFQVPVRVDGATVELSDWRAIPSSAVSFDPDPSSENGGVLITVLEPVEEITIAASTGPIGGTAPLYVTEATPEQWEMGEARYNNGVEYDLPMINLADLLLDPNYMPPETPTNLACNNCHTSGAKYLEIQHTPAQAAYISDDDLKTILTQGMKPEGISYSVLPPELEYLYADFHTWDASDEEIEGLIVYLRSLTPESQGDIVIPDNVFIPAM
jgi:hypothetical protein